MPGPVFCVECGCEAVPKLGIEAGVREPDLADATVWACTECPDSFTIADGHGAPVGWPGNEATRDARDKVLADQICRLLGEAPACHRETGPDLPVSLALWRIEGFLAAGLELSREDGRLYRLSLEQCREAWRILRRASYTDVQIWAARARDKRR